MTEKEPAEGTNGPADGSAYLAALASAMSRFWLSAAPLNGFPQADQLQWPDAAGAWQGIADAQMRAMLTSWMQFNQGLMTSTGAAWESQEQFSGKLSEQLAANFRGLTGLDPRNGLAPSGSDWSPHTVAVQSLGLADDGAAEFSAELAQLASTSSQTARAMLALCQVVGEAWLKAAAAFSEQGIAGQSAGGDPAALQRQWGATAEPILQQTLASEAYVKANAEFIRAASLQAKARSALARRFAQFIEVPDRQEMNEAYEAIQELRREVRSLRRNQKRLEALLAGGRGRRVETE